MQFLGVKTGAARCQRAAGGGVITPIIVSTPTYLTLGTSIDTCYTPVLGVHTPNCYLE